MKKALYVSRLLLILLIAVLCVPSTVHAAVKNTAKITTQKAKITMVATDTQMTVTAKKVRNATQYQFKYATNKQFRKTKTVTATTRTYRIMTKENKNYYVKCRAVMKKNGKAYYSKWSNTKAKIITKKAYHKTIVDKPEREDYMTQFVYDCYIPVDNADFDQHSIELAESGVPGNWSSVKILFPAETHVKYMKAKYKIITL